MSTGILTTKDYIHFTIIPDMIEFKGAEKANKCLPGDLVSWNFIEGHCECVTSTKHGKIVGVLELTSKTRYGLTSRGAPIFLFRPFDSSYPPFIVGSGQRDCTKNVLCSVIYSGDWKAPSTFPRGEICEYFGQVGDWKAERAAILARWCQNAPAKLNRIELEKWEEREPSADMLDSRHDLSWGITFHIDPEGCRDVDDILTIGDISVEDGSFKIAITIADVAAWVGPNSSIAVAAGNMGQTFYDESGQVLRPMLPTILSEKICSLKNTSSISGWKLGISLILTIDTDGTIKEPELKLTKILSTYIKTYTYDNFLNNVTKQYRNIILEQTNQIYLALGKALGRSAEFPHDTHTLIETSMLYYNWFVGNFLAKSASATKTLYRVQDAADAARISAWQAAATMTMGKTGGKDLEWIGVTAARYKMSDEDIANNTHASLGLQNYCHASSPIRRFADLYIQWLLHKELSGLRIISENVVSVDSDIVPKLNGRAAAAKKIGRELAIIAAIEKGKRDFEGICLEWKPPCGLNKEWRGYFWIYDWKEIAVIRQLDGEFRPELGKKCNIRCGVNLLGGIWKNRFVLEIKNVL